MRYHFPALLALVLIAALADAPRVASAQAQPARLLVRIDGVEPSVGALRVALFCDSVAYRTLKATQARVLAVDGSSVELVFEAAPSGECAILAHHDRNADGRLNLGFLGLPSEPTAASNGARVRFGPPGWQAVAFAVRTPETRHTVAFP